MRFSLGSELTYTALRDTTLILGVEAQRATGQRIVREQFTVMPGMPSEALEIGMAPGLATVAAADSVIVALAVSLSAFGPPHAASSARAAAVSPQSGNDGMRRIGMVVRRQISVD